MKPWPSRFDIFSAECRVAHSKLATRARFAQLRSALRSRLVKPSSLLVATSAGALLGVWFARRHKPQDKQEGVSVWAPIVGLASTLFIRFGMQGLAGWVRPRHPDTATQEPDPPGGGR
jgi:hypothetical protein